MTRARGVIAGLTLLAIVTILGTVGYVLIEDEDVFDAFYDTVITISTVGFAEPTGGLSTAGKVLTIFVVIAGVGSALYTATAGLELALERLLGGERRDRRDQTNRRENRAAGYATLSGRRSHHTGGPG